MLLHGRQFNPYNNPTEEFLLLSQFTDDKTTAAAQGSKVKAAKAKVGGQTRLEGQGSRISRGEAGEGQWESTERSPSTSRQSPPACGAPYQC